MDKKKSLVYVIILNWNGKKDTQECLDSLASQEYPLHKIIVVDNGSTDGSLEALRGMFPWVEFLPQKTNIGYAKGCNAGIKSALKKKADFIFLLNNDTVLHPKCIGRLVDAAQADPHIGIVGPKIYYHDQKDRIWFAGGRISYFLGNTWHLGNRRRDKGGYEGTIDADYVTGCAMLIKRELIERIGFFDANYHSYFEDCDLCVRANKQDYRVICAREACIWHKISASSGGGFTALKAYHKIVSGKRFFRSYAPPLLFRSSIPVFTGLYFITLVIWKALRGEFGFGRAVFQGVREAMRR